MNNKKIILLFIMYMFVISFYLFKDKTIENKSVIYLETMTVRTTYYCPKIYTKCSDVSSGCVTSEGANVCDLKMEHNQNKYPGEIILDGSTGWYFYRENGIDYLIIATDPDVHPLGNKYTLTIKGNSYNAIVMDKCGACMEANGGKVDVFTSGSSHLDSSIKDPQDASATITGTINSSNYSANPSTVNIDTQGQVTYSTSYTGDIKNGWLYLRLSFTDYVNETDADKLSKNMDEQINEIFLRATESYTSNTAYTGGDIITDPTGGDYSNWKQNSTGWGDEKVGNSGATMSDIGCLITSVAIQIKRSGTALTIADFNPGSFVQTLNSNNAFDGQGNFKWTGWSSIAPNWKFIDKKTLPATKSGKIEAVANYLNQNYYLVMCSKDNCGHWVAVTGVTSDENIIIIDPGANVTRMFPNYNEIAEDSNVVVGLFKKED